MRLAEVVSERLRLIVERLDIRPSDRVLEIGCGHGVAATFVCQRLENGHLTAIDRSAKMIAAAKRRNAGYRHHSPPQLDGGLRCANPPTHYTRRAC